MINIKQGFVFDDVLLVPKYSEINSRSDIDLSVDLGKGVKLSIPICNANMKSVASPEMVVAIAEMGGLGLMHRFYSSPEKDIWNQFNNIVTAKPHLIDRIGISVGVQQTDKAIIDQFEETVKIVCIDVAHADHIRCVEMVEYIAKKMPKALLIAGTVATPSGALRLADVGADVVRVGIGSGSICSTRIETGNGYPQLSALSNVYDRSFAGASRAYKIIADGGLRRGGDVTKALCFSDAAIIGNILAGTDETPGDIIRFNGKQYKEYAGSSTYKVNHVEGVSGLIPYKGSVKKVIQTLLEGVRSGLSYQGARNLDELREDPEFVQITNSGLVESHPHDIILGEKS